MSLFCVLCENSGERPKRVVSELYNSLDAKIKKMNDTEGLKNLKVAIEEARL